MTMMTSIQTAIEEALSAHAGKHISVSNSRSIGGGCINNAMKVETSEGIYFVKFNDANRFPGMFEAEAKGLTFLKKTHVIQVPEVITHGASGNNSFIILEFIESGARNKNFWENFGTALAALHKISAPQFGLDHDNYIGSLPQSNKFHNKWHQFFVQERLEKQVKIALDTRMLTSKHLERFEKLYAAIAEIFPDEPPALLHGDLWSGNFMTGSDGNGCIMDPAIFYGHREAELAFTQLFGGFDSRFYSAYQTAFPLAAGFEKRKGIYNLYPLLVHLNLFGSSYLSGVERTLKQFSP